LFAASGACALIYEVVWFKLFAQAWGSSALALAMVVACFLGGLGIGAWLGGRWAARARSALRAYALCELAIGALALALPSALAWLHSAAAPSLVALTDRPALLAAARLALTFAVLALPCALMGATLPLLIELFERSRRSLGTATAWLYAANTLGASAGAALAGFLFLPNLGLNGTNLLAAILNLAVATLAIAAARSGETVRPAAPAVAEPGPAPFESAPRATAAAVLSGMAALALQIVWSRQACLLLGGSTYSYAMVVAVFLAGLAAGSLLARAWMALGTPPQVLMAVGALCIVGFGLLGQELAPWLARLIGSARFMRSQELSNAAISAGSLAMLELGATAGMGLFLPALVAHRGGGARGAGSLVAWNTLGALLGAVLTGLLAFPRLGLFATGRLALGVYAILPFLAGVRQSGGDRASTDPRLQRWPLASALLGLAALAWTWHAPNQLRLNFGMYWYGVPLSANLSEDYKPLYFEEGASANVMVLEKLRDVRPTPEGYSPGRHLLVRANGKIDASNHGDMGMQLALAYFPRMLHPQAKDTFVIGLGSGTTAGASGLFPQARVTVAEIEPAMVEAARYFSEYNHDPHDNPNVRIVLDDGRGWLMGTNQTFDLILSEPTNPWIAGVSNLFTRQFYELVRARLNAGGVFAQWVQTYCFTQRDYARVAGTVLEVFPYAMVWRINLGDTLLMAWKDPVVWDARRLDEAQRAFDAVPAARIDLDRHFLSSDLRSLLLEGLLFDRRGLERLHLAAGRPGPVLDANLRLEFDTPLQLFSEREGGTEQMALILLGQLDPQVHAELALAWNCGPQQVAALKRLKSRLFQVGLVGQAQSLVELARAWNPEDGELAVDRLLFDPEVDEEEFSGVVAHLIENEPIEAYRLGKLLSQRGQNERALRVLEPLAEARPTSATCWTSLGIVYASLGREADAARAQRRASDLDPINELTRGIQRVVDRAEQP
jgi:spermidine synthase